MATSFLSTSISLIRDSAKYLLIGSALLLISCKPLDKNEVSTHQKAEPDLISSYVYKIILFDK